MTATLQHHHARPGWRPKWLRRGAADSKPVVTAVHGAALGDPMRTDYIVTGGHAVPAPALVERTEPVAVKTTTTGPDGTTTGYDTQPFSLPQPADQPQRVPGSTGLQPLVPVEPLTDAGMLERVRDGIRDLDGPPAYLQFWMHGKSSLSLREPLMGLPRLILGREPEGDRHFVALGWGGNEDGEYVTDEFTAERLVAVALAAIEGIPHLTSDPACLEAVIFAAQSALAASTMGGPVVEQQDGAR